MLRFHRRQAVKSGIYGLYRGNFAIVLPHAVRASRFLCIGTRHSLSCPATGLVRFSSRGRAALPRGTRGHSHASFVSHYSQPEWTADRRPAIRFRDDLSGWGPSDGHTTTGRNDAGETDDKLPDCRVPRTHCRCSALPQSGGMELCDRCRSGVSLGEGIARPLASDRFDSVRNDAWKVQVQVAGCYVGSCIRNIVYRERALDGFRFLASAPQSTHSYIYQFRSTS